MTSKSENLGAGWKAQMEDDGGMTLTDTIRGETHKLPSTSVNTLRSIILEIAQNDDQRNPSRTPYNATEHDHTVANAGRDWRGNAD